jgi:putative PIN family toxin of toxin-antitoxin system
MPTPRRYVLDANTVVSAVLLPSSVPRRALDKALDQGTVLLSPQTVTEMERVLSRPKLDRYVTERARLSFMVALVHESEIVLPSETVTVCRDPKDNIYLELAVSGNATCVVTGDADLLDLASFRGIPIVTARQFIESNL